MPFQKRPDQRRRVFLNLIGEIENGLRDAYGIRHEQKRINQIKLAEKLGINRSVVHHRLTGRRNLTVRSIADLVWGLDWGVRVEFYDPETERRNAVLQTPPPSDTQPVISQAPPPPNADPTSPRVALQ